MQAHAPASGKSPFAEIPMRPLSDARYQRVASAESSSNLDVAAKDPDEFSPELDDLDKDEGNASTRLLGRGRVFAGFGSTRYREEILVSEVQICLRSRRNCYSTICI